MLLSYNIVKITMYVHIYIYDLFYFMELLFSIYN